MKRLIISLGVGGNFAKGVKRMAAGARANGYAGDIWSLDKYPRHCPTHQEIPYGFKPHLVNEALSQGYDQVLWLDAACVPVKPLTRLWYEIERDGCAFQLSSWSIGQWTSDACLGTMGVTRAQAMVMKPSIWACAMGFDLRNPVIRQFVAQWHTKSLDGISFHGAWTNENHEVSQDPRVTGHRHDQSVATILMYQLGLPLNAHVVDYDVGEIMPLEGYEPLLRLPQWRVPILSNHNVK